MKPVIALTMGDPAGVGPEICLKAAADPRVLGVCTPVIIGSETVLSAVAGKLRLRVPPPVDPHDVKKGFAPAAPRIVDMNSVAPIELAPGKVSAACGRAAFEYVNYAIRQTLAGAFDGITTAPINKDALHRAGFKFPGHTEILDEITRTVPGRVGRAVMMLYSPRITVTLATIHVAMRDVPALLTTDDIAYVIRVTAESMRRVLGRAPRLAVLAYNCHAGENGLFGDEEIRVIAPAVARAKADGIDVAGPLPPDTAFTAAALKRFDAHVCMYHDQGLIPFKAISFEDGVNVTLGIPIIRTSVDHGTAFDIAWQGVADHSSLVAALLLAARMAC